MEDISFTKLSNPDLIAAVSRYARDERAATAQLIASMAEFDRRRLYLDEGFNSMFDYCVRALSLSEHAAYGRIEAARLTRTFPVVVDMLHDGSLTLTNLCLLKKHLTNANHIALLQEAKHLRKSEVELIVARLNPQPDVPSVVRKLPAPIARAVERKEAVLGDAAPLLAAPPLTMASAPHSALAAAPHKPAVIAPLTPERYKIQVTVDRETREVLRQAQDLMRHTIPNGDPALIIARALRLLVDDLLKKKSAATKRLSAGRKTRTMVEGSRAIPASVKREVWKRDGGRCTFEGSRGLCGERGSLEYHHVIPYAMGGEATVDNIELRCRAHNAHEAELDGLVRLPARDRRHDFDDVAVR